MAAAIMRALERDREKRWQTAADFADALERAASAVGGIASSKRVAEHVTEVSGAKIARERERVRSARPAASPPREDAQVPVDVSVVTREETNLESSSDVRAPSRRRALQWLAIGGALVVGAGYALIATRSQPPRAASEPKAVAPSSTASSAPAPASDSAEAPPPPPASATIATTADPSSAPSAAPSSGKPPSMPRRPPAAAPPPVDVIPRNPYRR